jgi:ribosomal protein S18 acetylase RimI-like enzyme
VRDGQVTELVAFPDRREGLAAVGLSEQPMSQENVEITQAVPDRLSALASVLGRAFAVEPMMRWPLGESNDVEERLIRAFELFMEDPIRLGMVWEAGAATGALIWIPADQMDAVSDGNLAMRRVYEREDGARRFDRFWAWVESKHPDEPLALLDSVAVEPAAQGRGIGSALIRFGLERAQTAGSGAWIETGNPRNVPLYQRQGFRVVEDADAPGGGPHIWFMRWDP